MTFELKKLSELCTKITDGSHYSPKEVASGVPMYSVKDMTQFGFSDATVKRISEDEYEALVKADCTPRVNDVLIAKDGSVLKHVFSIESEVRGALLSSIAILRPNLSLVDSDFLAYALQDPVLRSDVLSNYVSGSGVPRIVLKDFKNISIQTPTIEIQRRISKLLKSLDRKIQRNIAISETLEEISQTFFKSWFIDFDPVKAKMAGKEPVGMDDETASLFPGSMVESETGLIPAGWSIVKVEDLLSRLTIKGLPKSIDLKNSGRTLVLEQGNSVIAGFVDQEADVLASSDAPKFIFGDHTCRMRLSTVPFSVFPNTIVLDSKTVDTYWAFQATNGLQRFETYRRHWMELAYKCVTVPTGPLAEAFGSLVEPLFSQIDALMLESRTLVEIRDAILPRLISGEIQIPEEMLAS